MPPTPLDFMQTITILTYLKIAIKNYLDNNTHTIDVHDLIENGSSIDDELAGLNANIEHLRCYFDRIANTNDFYARQVAIQTGISVLKQEISEIERQRDSDIITIHLKITYAYRDKLIEAMGILSDEADLLMQMGLGVHFNHIGTTGKIYATE